MPRPLRDISGQRFGKWTVRYRCQPPAGDHHTYWICLCDCGREAAVLADNLHRGRSTQCRTCANRRT